MSDSLLDTSYQLRPLTEKDLGQMHRSFMEAFADYSVPYKLTLEEFVRKMKHKVHVDFQHSFGSFSNQKLVAFVFHALGNYENVFMAYNGGTGVVPGHRGNRLISKIYDQIIPVFEQTEINRCVLEVLTHNHRAISIYKGLGFEETKLFHCFKLTDGGLSDKILHPVQVNEHPNLTDYANIGHCRSCFGDTLDQLQYNIQFETVLEVREDEELAGYLIFQPQLARITRFAVVDRFKGRGVARALFLKALALCRKPLTVINVNKEYEEMILFLERIGFKNTLDQYEMQLTVE